MINILVILAFLLPYIQETPASGYSMPPWPDGGPKPIFELNNLGNGYASPTITESNLYVTGEFEGVGYLFSFDLQGNLKWKTGYGNEWSEQYPGSRSAPALAGDLIYTGSGKGDIACFDARNGAKKWSLNMIRDLKGVEISFGHSMPLVIEGDLLFCSPSGETNNIVALNRFTGKMIWSTPANGETAGYGSPLVIDTPHRKVLVNSSEFSILGLDAATGKMLWFYELSFKGDQPCNAPLYDGRYLYWIAGKGNGAVAALLSPDGGKIDIVWKNKKFDTYFGGFVKKGRFLYGSADSRRDYVSVDAESGIILDSLSFGTGSVIHAENMLIVYNQKGMIGLVKPNGARMDLVSSFRLTKGSGEHFSHPVYSNGNLYVRHGNTLTAYSVGTRN